MEETFSTIKDRYKEIASDLELKVDLEEIFKEIKSNMKENPSKDYIASRGEYLNGILLAEYLGFDFIDPKDILIFKEDGSFDIDLSEEKVAKGLKNIKYAVIPGFYGAKEDGQIITFSRGGSDYSGALVANGVRADLYENWTDVSGFLMADPRLVEDAKTIELVTYKEVRELCYMGAPVLHDETMFLIRKYGIPVNIKNTNRPEDKGTMIVDESSEPPIKDIITGISGKRDFTVITVEKNLMNSEVGFIKKLVSIFEKYHISIEHVPSSIDSLSVIVANEELNSKMDKVIEDINLVCQPDNILIHNDIALIAVVGRGIKKQKGLLASIFMGLAKADISVRMISQDYSQLNIIIAISGKDFDKAIKIIYETVK